MRSVLIQYVKTSEFLKVSIVLFLTTEGLFSVEFMLAVILNITPKNNLFLTVSNYLSFIEECTFFLSECLKILGTAMVEKVVEYRISRIV